ncbi:MAG: WecB/TagA/CpsF family glycosyltransferase [Bacteroidota bacterium]|nr:WecB/TagA/CpsF family glycosyltransferase [Bacteroidota bacterium]
MVTANLNNDFRKILNEEFFLNLPDGMPAVWVGRIKGAKKMQRCYGPDFFKYVLKESANTEIKHFFCGGKEGVADELKKECEISFNNKNVVGTFCPPFRKMTESELLELSQKVKKTNANIVWIGLSTPKQEEFAVQLKSFLKDQIIITVGAAFDFHTGKVRQAPKWIQKIGMEWFFRLAIEPKRLYKRYSLIVPLFLYYNLVDFIKYLLLVIKEKNN